MGGLPWQRRWDPFRELQREVGRLFESWSRSTPYVTRIIIRRSTSTTRVTGISCRPNCRA